jgi:putative transposase
MTRPYSEDLRERALARFEAGETIRSIGAGLKISPSCVSKWHKLKRETGGLEPSKIGGYRKPTLSGAIADWLRERCRSAPFTTRGLTGELASRGIKTDRRAVWVFVRAEGLSFKKNAGGGRTDPA